MTQNVTTPDLRTYYAPEVECALVSLCWHKPELLARVLRKLDPEIHFTELNCRMLLYAINTLYSELGETDWSSVIDCLRQQEKLFGQEHLVELEAIFSLAQGYDRASSGLLDYYIELLGDYASLRRPSPHAKPPVLRFSGGRALLKPNKAKRPGSNEPDFKGLGIVAGNPISLSLWVETDQHKQTTLNLSIQLRSNAV